MQGMLYNDSLWVQWVFAGILSRYCRKPQTWTKFSSTKTGRGVHWRPQRNIMWFPAVLRLTSPVIKSPGPPPPQPQVRHQVILELLSCVYSRIIGLILLLKTNFYSRQFYFAIYFGFTYLQRLNFCDKRLIYSYVVITTLCQKQREIFAMTRLSWTWQKFVAGE